MGCPPAHTRIRAAFLPLGCCFKPVDKGVCEDRREGNLLTKYGVSHREATTSVPYVFSSGKYSPDSVGRCGSSTQSIEIAGLPTILAFVKPCLLDNVSSLHQFI